MQHLTGIISFDQSSHAIAMSITLDAAANTPHNGRALFEQSHLTTHSIESTETLRALKSRRPKHIQLQTATPRCSGTAGAAWVEQIKGANIRAYTGSTTALFQTLPGVEIYIAPVSNEDWHLAVACVAAGLRTHLVDCSTGDVPALREAIVLRALRVRPKAARDIEQALAVSGHCALGSGQGQDDDDNDLTQEDLDRLTGRAPMQIMRDVSRPMVRRSF